LDQWGHHSGVAEPTHRNANEHGSPAPDGDPSPLLDTVFTGWRRIHSG